MTSILGAIFVFILIIALHEFGHFSVAKLVGIRVNEYAIGMGPLLFKTTKGETQYSLRALPIGGYVAMEGEETASDDPRAFSNASVPKRAAVIAAGASMNFVLAIVTFAIYLLIGGYPTTTVQEVIENSPASRIEIQSGDELISINGREIASWEEFSNTIADATHELTIGIRRDSEKKEFRVKPQIKEGRGFIGIKPETETHPLRAVKDGFKMTGKTIAVIFNVLQKLFTGELGVDKLSGPVGVVKIIGDSAKVGFASLMFITGYISANLGIMNLLPIPALDGGKLLFLAVEGVSGRKVNEKIEMGLSLLSFALLFGLMIYVTIFGDMARFIG